MAAIALPRFPDNWQDQPYLVSRYWDEAMLELEKTLNAVLAIPIIEDALSDLDTAVGTASAAAAAATSAAAAATSAAAAAASEQSLVNSYIDPSSFTAPLISADSAGNVTIANHSRTYGDVALNPTVAVTGDTIATAASPTSVVRVYYSDPTRAGGTVTYLFTIDPAAPMPQGGDIHSIGAVEIPAAGASDGDYLKPPGYVDL